MTEEKLNALRQQDTNLRDALKMDEAERAPMPADLNERLMQRMVVEEKKPRRIVIWPWIAAACVAGVMIIWLTPPKASSPTPLQVERGVVAQDEKQKVEEPKMAKVETEATQPASTPVKLRKAQVQSTVAKRDAALVAQETPVAEPVPTATSAVSEPHADIAMAEKPQKEAKTVTLTERDIPITRPENYHYTAEEIALMKKQANEAYLKWAQLEVEIAKHNLEQTAQQ